MNIESLGSSIIPFESQSELILSVLHSTIATIGLIGGVVVFIPTLVAKNTPSSLLLLSLCWADLVVCFCCAYLGIKDVIHGGWSSGVSGCIIDAIMIDAGCFASIFSIFAITWERYNSVTKRTVLTFKTAILWIIVVWVATMMIAVFPFYTLSSAYSVALQPAKIVCVITWWDRHPGTIAIVTLCIFILVTTLCFMLYAYMKIIWNLKRVIDPLKKFQPNAPSIKKSVTSEVLSMSVATDKMLNNPKLDTEKALFIKCIIICGTYIACWTPYMSMMIYMVVLGKPAPWVYDAICN
ncbi:hypothetical protein HDV01_002796 [Terramyces sp. JEL0728]|nr:hypothetical protein HDV01_002796 [Terramyces sp. JEL0728]